MTDDNAGKLEKRLKSYQEAETKRLKGLEKEKKEPAKDSELRAIRSRKKKLERRIQKIKMRDVNYSLKYSEKKLEVLNQLRDAMTKSGLKAEHARVRSLSKKIKSLNKTIRRLNKTAEKEAEKIKSAQEVKQTEQKTDELPTGEENKREETKQQEVKEQKKQEEKKEEQPTKEETKTERKTEEKKEEEKAKQEEKSEEKTESSANKGDKKE